MGKSKYAKRRDVSPPPRDQPSSQWSRLADQLQGLLSVQIDDPFVDLEHLCPRGAWLVLHLDLIRPVANIRLALDALAVLCVRSERLRLDEKLYEAYWRQMLTSDMMRDASSANAPVVSKFVRFVRHKNVRVMLSWQGKRFQSIVASQLRSFLDATVDKYTSIADSLDGCDDGRAWRVWRSLGVDIRFESSSLTRDDVKSIKTMLSQPSEATANPDATTNYLCEQHTLRKLDLHGNRLGASELRDLASLLENSQCRRIDALDLENTFPENAIESTDNSYVSAFKRVVVAALTAKPKPHSTTYVRADAGVALSLARNTMYDGLHLEALHNALETASRPLSALSLAYTKHEHSAGSSLPSSSSLSQKWLARICMTSPPTSFTEDALLDLTLADMESDMDKFHGELTDVVVPRLREALANNETIRCRVHKKEAYETQDQGYTGNQLESHATYPVLEVAGDGWCRILQEIEDDSDDDEEATEASEATEADEADEGEEDDEADAETLEEEDAETLGEEEQEDAPAGDERDANTWWIRLTQIIHLYTDNATNPDILRMRFSSLVCNGDNDKYGPIMAPKSSFLRSFLASTGRDIQRISLRRWHDMDIMLSPVLSNLPQLRELDLEGSDIGGDSGRSLWARIGYRHWETLVVINVSGANIGTTFFSELHGELEEYDLDDGEPLQVNLRYLSMLDCTLDVSQVVQLRDFLRTNKSLELVELDARVVPSNAHDEPTPSKMALSVSLDHDHERLDATSSLSVDRKVAFACTLPKIPHFQNADIDSAILSRCLEYAGHVATRRIVWCDSVPLRKWFRLQNRSSHS